MKIKSASFALVLALVFSFTLSGCSKNTQTALAVNGQPMNVATKLDTSDMFTDTDKEIGYDTSNCTEIKLSDKSVTINKGGYYIVSGSLSNGQLIIDADNSAKIHIILNGVTINCDTSAAIYVKQADKVFVTLAKGTTNTLSNKKDFVQTDDNTVDGVIFSKDDITFNGLGTLTINAAYGHGIVSKNDLAITSGTYNITAASHGLQAKDSVKIADGTFTVKSGKDAIHAENSDDTSKGYVYISNGEFNITSEGDGIDASAAVQIDGGKFTITTGGGSKNSTKSNNMMGGGQGGFTKPNTTSGSDTMQQPTTQDGTTSQPELPSGNDGGTPPQMSGDSQMGTPPEMPQGGQGDQNQQQMQPGQNSSSTSSGSTTENSSDDSDDTVSTKGIKADGDIIVTAGTFTIDSMDDSFHSNKNLQVDDGTININAGDDAFHANTNLAINGGTIKVTKSYESIEGQKIYITDGDITVTASDDGLNAATPTSTTTQGGEKGTMQNDSNCLINITGGKLTVTASGDGIDSNGSVYVTGGETLVNGPSSGADAPLDYNGSATITGGSFIASGSSSMAENFGTDSTQGAILVTNDSSCESGTKVELKDSGGNTIASFSPTQSFDTVIISSSKIKKGETYTLTIGDTTKTVKMTDIIYGTGSEQGGMVGNGGGMQNGGGQAGQGGGKGGLNGGFPGRGNNNTTSSQTASSSTTTSNTINTTGNL